MRKKVFKYTDLSSKHFCRSGVAKSHLLLATSKHTKLFPVGWKFSDSFPPNGDCTEEKMKFFQANHNGWYVYRGIHSDHVPKIFKDRSPNPSGIKGKK